MKITLKDFLAENNSDVPPKQVEIDGFVFYINPVTKTRLFQTEEDYYSHKNGLITAFLTADQRKQLFNQLG